MIAVPLMSACAKPATPAQVITLKFHTSEAKGVVYDAAPVWWCEEVEKRTRGAVKFEIIYAGALGKLTDQPVNLQGGLFDLGRLTCLYNPGLYPALTVNTLPFLTEDIRAITLAGMEIVKHPAMQKEFAALNSKELFHWFLDPMEIMSHVPAKTIAELKPLKIRAVGGAADAFTAAGLTPVGIPWGDLASAGERHVVDAACVPVPTTSYDAGLHEIFKYALRVPVHCFHLSMAINLDSWNKLSPDVQKVMLDVAKEAPLKQIEFQDKARSQAWAAFDKSGVQQVQWSKDELSKFKEVGGKPVWEKWVKDMEAKGIPGREILDQFQKLIAKNGG